MNLLQSSLLSVHLSTEGICTEQEQGWAGHGVLVCWYREGGGGLGREGVERTLLIIVLSHRLYVVCSVFVRIPSNLPCFGIIADGRTHIYLRW